MRIPASSNTRTPSLLEAVKCDRLNPALGDVTYCVIDDVTDARGRPRRRTRLRTGKVIGLDNTFLGECQIYDRSALGARIRLLAEIEVPVALRLFEDATGDAVDAQLIWLKGREAGIRFTCHPGAKPLNPAQKAGLAGKYYAVGV